MKRLLATPKEAFLHPPAESFCQKFAGKERVIGSLSAFGRASYSWSECPKSQPFAALHICKNTAVRQQCLNKTKTT